MGNFEYKSLAISDVATVVPRKFADSRGYFMETYSFPAFADLGISASFVQDNQSLSVRRGTIRGLHFQKPPYAQAKLVRVLRGAIADFAVDLRRASPTYGEWCSATLTALGGEQMFVPRGFAHAFCTLEDNTEVAYKVDNPYDPRSDAGLFWDDPDLAIAWPVSRSDICVSEKDERLPAFATFETPF